MGKVIIDLEEKDYEIENIDAEKGKSSVDKNMARKKTSKSNIGKSKETKKLKMTKEEHTKIESKIRSLEKKRDLLYSQFYTDDSKEMKELNAELRRLYNKVPKEVKKRGEQKAKGRQTSGQKMTAEQIKIKSEIEKLENEKDLLYSQFYTDDSQEIKEINEKLHKLYGKMPKIKANKDNKDSKKDTERSKVKLTPEQLKIKAEIEELKNERNLLYSQFYTDDSQEIKDIDEKLRKLYEKMPKDKKPEPKLTEGQLKIKAEIEKLENERDLLYSQFYTDDSQEIKDIQARINKLYDEMKKPVKPEKKPEPKPEKKPNKKPEPKSRQEELEEFYNKYPGTRQNPEPKPEKKPNKKPEPKSRQEELEEFYNKYPGTRPNPEPETPNLPLPKQTKLDKFLDFAGGVLEKLSAPFRWMANTRLGKFFGKIFSKIAKFATSKVEAVALNEIEAEVKVDEELAKVEEEIKKDIEPEMMVEKNLDEEKKSGTATKTEAENQVSKEELKTQKEMAREIRKIIKENEGKDVNEIKAYEYKGVEIENTGSLKVIADYLEGKKKIQGKGRVVVSKKGERLRLQPDGSLKHEKTFEERLRDNKAAKTKEEENIPSKLKEAIDKIEVNKDWDKGER